MDDFDWSFNWLDENPQNVDSNSTNKAKVDEAEQPVVADNTNELDIIVPFEQLSIDTILSNK